MFEVIKVQSCVVVVVVLFFFTTKWTDQRKRWVVEINHFFIENFIYLFAYFMF